MKTTSYLFLAIFATAILSTTLKSVDDTQSASPWINSLPEVFADASDHINLDLSRYLKLKNLKTVTTSKCSDVVSFKDTLSQHHQQQHVYAHHSNGKSLEGCKHFV